MDAKSSQAEEPKQPKLPKVIQQAIQALGGKTTDSQICTWILESVDYHSSFPAQKVHTLLYVIQLFSCVAFETYFIDFNEIILIVGKKWHWLGMLLGNQNRSRTNTSSAGWSV